MKKIVVIVDFAHGSNVPGKCSPDKTHREWMWSRRVGNDIATMLKVLGFQVYFSNPLDTEGGLTPRVRFAENLKVAPGQHKFMLSLHNNAGGMGDKWVTARGFEVWTKQGFDLADVMAEKAFPVLKKWFPSMKQRLATNEEFKKDKEGNLAVLKGEGVYSLLFEYLFQDNKEDVQLLLSEKENKKFADAIVDVVENMEEYLNLNK